MSYLFVFKFKSFANAFKTITNAYAYDCHEVLLRSEKRKKYFKELINDKRRITTDNRKNKRKQFRK